MPRLCNEIKTAVSQPVLQQLLGNGFCVQVSEHVKLTRRHCSARNFRCKLNMCE